MRENKVTHFEDFCAAIPYIPDNVMKHARLVGVSFPVSNYDAAEIEFSLVNATKSTEWTYWASLRTYRGSAVLEKVRTFKALHALEEELEMLNNKVDNIFYKKDRYPLCLAAERDRIQKVIDNSYNFLCKG